MIRNMLLYISQSSYFFSQKINCYSHKTLLAWNFNCSLKLLFMTVVDNQYKNLVFQLQKAATSAKQTLNHQ